LTDIFLSRVSVLTVRSRFTISVCPSVCLSVCPTFRGVVSKPQTLEGLIGSIIALIPAAPPLKASKLNPVIGVVKCTTWGESRNYSESRTMQLGLCSSHRDPTPSRYCISCIRC